MRAAALSALALLALAASALAGHIDHHYDHHHDTPYKYEYSVHDPHHGDVKSQHESGHGGQVKGSYSLVEPDGHVRKVEYTADKHNGFQAVVSRQGHGTTVHGYGKADEQNHHAAVAATLAQGHGYGHGHEYGHGAGYGAGVGAGVGAGYGAGVGAGYGAGVGAGYGAGIGYGHGHAAYGWHIPHAKASVSLGH